MTLKEENQKIIKNLKRDKALIDNLEKTVAGLERVYIKKINYKNADGSVPSDLCAIKNEKDFDRLCSAFSCTPEVRKAEKEIIRLSDCVKKLENILIERTITLAPESIQATLRKGLKLVSTRHKILDLALRHNA